jgi:hypothetical protein
MRQGQGRERFREFFEPEQPARIACAGRQGTAPETAQQNGDRKAGDLRPAALCRDQRPAAFHPFLAATTR